MTLLEVDPQLFWSLDDREQTRLKDGLHALGVDPTECTCLYTDEKGKVVGAIRFLRDADGKPLHEDGELLIEHVGLVPVTVADRLRIYEVTAPLVGDRRVWPIRVLADGDGPAGTGAEVPPPSLPLVPASYRDVFSLLRGESTSRPFEEVNEMGDD